MAMIDGDRSGWPVVWLDVVRRGKPVTIRLQVAFDAVTGTINRAQLHAELAQLRNADLRELAVAQPTRDGKPSGVLSRAEWYNTQPLTFGDMIRKAMASRSTRSTTSSPRWITPRITPRS